MPFEFVIQFHRRVDGGSGDGQVQTERTSIPSNRPTGLELYLSENRIDFGGIMQALFSNMDQALSTSHPTAKSVIDNLPKLDKYTGDPESTCPVCLEAFSKSDEVVTQLECKHFFHLKCIKPWLSEHNTCPTCRSEMKTEEVAAESDPFFPISRREPATARTSNENSINTSPALTTRDTAPSVTSRRIGSVNPFTLLSSRREQTSRREQSRGTIQSTITTSPRTTSMTTPRTSARLQSSSPRDAFAPSSLPNPTRRQPRRGVKRSARQQSQGQASNVAENDAVTTQRPDHTRGENPPTGNSRRTRRRLSSSNEQGRARDVSPRNGGLALLSYVAATSSNPHSSRERNAQGRGGSNTSTRDSLNSTASARSGSGGGSRQTSLFPFHVQQLLPLPELTDVDMDGPLRALFASVSASTRAANTASSSLSTSTQTQSRTSNRALHLTHTTSATRTRGDEDVQNRNSNFMSGIRQRIQSGLQAAEETIGDSRAGPYRRRANVQVRMRRFRVGRARNSSTAGASAQNSATPALAESSAEGLQ